MSGATRQSHRSAPIGSRLAADVLAGAESLGARPACLLLALVALNAVARPYVGLRHDANLYALQVLNRVHHGAFADDLFLRYGSQDRFSVFSAVLEPFTALVGLEWSFYACYLLSTALLILGLTRLARAIVADGGLSTLAVCFMVATPLTFGAFHTFHVHEPFLSPRIGAEALVAFGLERLLRERFSASIGLMGLAMLLHPIMAAGGVTVWLGSVLVAGESSGWMRAARSVLLGCVVVGAVGVGLLAGDAFGHIDSTWMGVVRAASPHTLPSEWRSEDWAEATALFLVILVAAWKGRHEAPARSRFLALVAATAAGGLLATAIAETMGYALPFQAQLYRALWIPKALQVPMGLWLIRHWVQSGRAAGRIAAAVLIGYFAASHLGLDALLLPGLLLTPVALLLRGAARRPVRAAWLPLSIATSLVLGFAMWSVMAQAFVLSFARPLLLEMSAAAYGRLLIATLGPSIWLVAIVGALALVSRIGGFRWVPAAAVATMVAVPWMSGVLARPGEPVDLAPSQRAELDGARRYLARRSSTDQIRAHAQPTVYGYWGRIDFLWFGLAVTSYFDTYQLAGALFNRETAIEGQRRALVARPFELERIRTALLPPTPLTNHWVSRLYRSGMDATSPVASDVLRLCGETTIDIAILRHAFPGLYVATTGPSFIYDCSLLRSGPPRGRGATS